MEGGVERGGDLGRLLGEIAGQAQRGSDGAAVMRHEAGGGIDREAVDFLGRRMRDFLDIHAAFGRDDEGDAAGRTIDEEREVEFLGDVGAVGDVEAVDLLAGLTRLDRHQRVAEHVGGVRADLVEREGEANTALRIRAEFLELALAAAAGMDLRLHDEQRPGQLLRGFDRLFDGEGGVAGGDRRAELRQQFLGLIFVDVHGADPLRCSKIRPP